VQRGLNLALEFRLIVLHDQQVIAATVAHRLREIAMGKHGVAGHDFTLDRQDL
jgi:hypothetical protein